MMRAGRPFPACLAFFVSLALALAGSPSLADPLPPGWSQREDGAFVHQQSTAVCPLEIAGHKRTGIEAGAAPVLGICSYAKGSDMTGVIRVRSYVPGQGETQMAIENDRLLMAPGSTTVSTGRMPPMRPSEGKQRLVLTVTRGGLLIDCDSTYPWVDAPADATTGFSEVCIRQFDKH